MKKIGYFLARKNQFSRVLQREESKHQMVFVYFHYTQLHKEIRMCCIRNDWQMDFCGATRVARGS